jgi:predicted  nucleic acid-binding Zn-ribbon protein
MTSRAPAWFEQKYIAGAIHALQSDGYLTKGLTAAATSQKGNQVNWKVAGRGDASVMSEAVEDRPTLNADRTLVTGTMVPWEANEWILTTDLARMTEAEQQVAAQTCGYAMGRAFDRILFTELDAQAGAITTIGNGTANLDLINLLDGQQQIMAQGITGDMVINVAVPFRWQAALMLLRGYSSADYIQDSPLLKKIGARNYLGMRIIPMPDEYFAIPASNQADGYMWASSAVGFATPSDDKGMIEMATRIDYVPTKKAYFAANTMMALARTILPGGVRRLRFSTNAALTSGL